MQNTRPELFLTPARLNYRDRSVVRVHTDRIACICPQSGRVVGWIDLTGLLPSIYQLESEAVFNGIAYGASSDRRFVTGKLWPKLFEIELTRR